MSEFFNLMFPIKYYGFQIVSMFIALLDACGTMVNIAIARGRESEIWRN